MIVYTEGTTLYYFTNENHEVEGLDYLNLIRCCTQYCTHFSLVFWRSQLFGRYQLPVVPYLCKATQWRQTPAQGCYEEHFKCYYQCTEDAITYLYRRVNNLFDWVRAWEDEGLKTDNPEDITFYREDGSVFFQSITHEGDCWLFPREGEFVEDIISRPGWKKADKKPILFEF